MSSGRTLPREIPASSRFDIVTRLGAGGMGVVYRAWDRELEVFVALKTLQRHKPEWLAHFKREFRALQGLDHPNLVRYGELFGSRDYWFFTMELVEGVDFMSWVRHREGSPGPDISPSADTLRASRVVGTIGGDTARDDWQRLRDALRQLALGLSALHQAGKVHRDVKPSNVMVDRDGRAVLLDFGFVKELVPEHEGDNPSADVIAIGTAEYMAPEQAAGADVGPAADWYAVGVMMYEALTGRLPFAGAPLQILLDKQRVTPRTPRTLNPAVPEDLDQLCTALLAFDPARRPPGPAVLRRLGVLRPPTLELIATPPPTQAAPFVGRDSELELLRMQVRDAFLEGGGTTMLVGGSGLGKTALIRRLVDGIRPDHPDAVVLSGRCFERETTSFKAFDGIVDALARHLRRLPDADAIALLPRDAQLLTRMFPALARVEAIARAPRTVRDAQRHDLRARGFAAVRELFARLADRDPLVLVIDDLQWADSDSLLLLDELLRQPDAPAMFLLVTCRTGHDGAAPAQFTGLLRDPMVVRMRPLSIDDGAELADRLAMLSGASERIDSRAIAREARGHPLHILELVRHIAARGSSDKPPRLEDSVRARVEALGEHAHHVAELVSLASAPLPYPVLRHAARLEGEVLERAVSLLRVAQVLHQRGGTAGTLEPAHDRVRQALTAPLEPEHRRELHERLAIAIEIEGGRPEMLVRHLEGAGDRQRAAHCARDAAEHAFETFAFDLAAELRRAALRLGEFEPDTRLELELGLGEALTNAGRGVEAADVFLAAAEHCDPVMKLECRRQAAEQLLKSGHIDAGLEALRALLAEIRISLPPTPRRALVSLLWNRGRLRLRGLRWKRRNQNQLSREQVLNLDALKAVSHGLAMVDIVRGSDFNSRFLLMALETGEITRLVRALGTEIPMCAAQGGRGLRRAHKLLAFTNRIIEPEQDPYLRGWVLSATGATSYFEGDFPRASETLDRAVSEFLNQAQGASWEINNTRMFRLFALRQMGAFRELADAYAQTVRDASARGDRYVETSVRRYCSILWLARDLPDDARDNLDAARWSPPIGRFHLQHWFELEACSELALYEGRAAEMLAEQGEAFFQLERELVSRVQIVRALARFARARLLIAAAGEGDRDEREREAAALARKLERERVSYAGVLASQIRASLALAAGDDDGAVHHLRVTSARADQCGMALMQAAAHRVEAELIGGSRGDELRARADGFMEQQGVVDTARLAGIILPGWRR